MNKFVFENATKAYFGEGCVKEHLPRILEEYAITERGSPSYTLSITGTFTRTGCRSSGASPLMCRAVTAR